MSRRIFVGNVNDRISENSLRRHFAAAGEVTSVVIPKDRKTGAARGYALVDFSNREQAALAIQVFNGRQLGGQKLRVGVAEERPGVAQEAQRRLAPRHKVDLDAIAEEALQRFENKNDERRPSPGRRMKDPL
ncbi:MAG: RNA-binding protein [Thermoanaerobaculia bacterium]